MVLEHIQTRLKCKQNTCFWPRLLGNENGGMVSPQITRAISVRCLLPRPAPWRVQQCSNSVVRSQWWWQKASRFKKRKTQPEEMEIRLLRKFSFHWTVFLLLLHLKAAFKTFRVSLDLWYFSFMWKDNTVSPPKGSLYALLRKTTTNCLGASVCHLRIWYKKYSLPISEMKN